MSKKKQVEQFKNMKIREKIQGIDYNLSTKSLRLETLQVKRVSPASIGQAHREYLAYRLQIYQCFWFILRQIKS